MDFSEFKKNRNKAQEAVKKLKDKKPNFTDDRFWNIKKDQQGNGDAVIRFLPGMSQEDEPFIQKFTHGFKENNKWFIEDCPVTVKRDCACCNHAVPFWEEDTKESKIIAGKFWRKKQYIGRIKVIKDISNPDNNGKIFLYKFGQKIYNKIMATVSPDSELDEPILVWDLWDGLDFKLIIRKVDGHANYDQCKFYDKKSAVANTDAEIEAIYKEICKYDLNEFIDPKKYKSTEEMEKKFNSFMGIKKGTTSKKAEIEKKEESVQDDIDDSKIMENMENEKEPEKEKAEPKKEDEPKKDDVVEEEFSFDDSEEDFKFDE